MPDQRHFAGESLKALAQGGSLNSIEGILGSDDIRVLTVMNPTRITKLPKVPTAADSGL
jgi:tripartite-type tricarboxylate transporter receptor subunit TctC